MCLSGCESEKRSGVLQVEFTGSEVNGTRRVKAIRYRESQRVPRHISLVLRIGVAAADSKRIGPVATNTHHIRVTLAHRGGETLQFIGWQFDRCDRRGDLFRIQLNWFAIGGWFGRRRGFAAGFL